MKVRTATTCFLAAAVGLLAVPGTHSGGSVPGGRGDASALRGLFADGVDPFLDSDDDFLPDAVEWAVVTSPENGDTDRDGVPDFVEVVQRGSPLTLRAPMPQDHEMRVVVNSTPVGTSGARQTWLHLLFRFMGETSLLTSFQSWIQISQMPGIPIGLDGLGSGQMVLRQRQVSNEGLWVSLSVPMGSEQMLRQLLPCTIAAQARIGGRDIRTGVKLFDIRNTTATLVPFREGFAVQSISPAAPMAGGGSNRICVLGLTEAGNGVSGTIYRVATAECDDCNDLECGVGCPETVGWVFVVPGGIETITGGG